LKERLEQLKDRQRKEAGEALEEMATSMQASAGDKFEMLVEDKELMGAPEAVSGDWSPRLITDISEFGDDVTVLDPTEDWSELVSSSPPTLHYATRPGLIPIVLSARET